MNYLEFEKPIKELIDKLKKATEIGETENIDTSKTISDIKKRLKEVRKNIFEHLTPWQKVQLSRHP